MFDSIAPTTSIARATPPALDFANPAVDDDVFDDMLRDSAAEEPAPPRERPAAERSERKDDRQETKTARAEPAAEPAAKPAATKADEPAAPTETKADAKDSAPADAPAAKDDSAPAAEDTATATAAPVATDGTVNASAPSVLLAALQVDPTKLAPGRIALSSTGTTDLPTLQQLLAGNGNGNGRGDGFGQSGSGHPQGDRPLPEALARLLQPSSAAGLSAAAAGGNAGQGSFQAALASTALGTTVKPDAGTAATAATGALPTAAAAAALPASGIAPLPTLDATQPLAGTGIASHASEPGGALKHIATLGATPGRAAAPATTPSLQLAVHIARAAQDGMGKVSVRLDPPELGRVDVKLELGHDGRVQAVVSADRPETLNMLQRDARDLARALQDAGLQADTGDLNFNLRQNGGEGTPSNDGGGNGARGGPLHADEPLAGGMADAGAVTPVTVASDRALDITV